MTIANPAQAKVFNDSYDRRGTYISDDTRVPYYNPADSGVMIEPGEPVLMDWNGAKRVFMAQGPIRPGDTGELVRYFTADFNADLSANVVLGAQLYWDFTEKVVSLAADVTNGFLLGNASYAWDPALKNTPPAVDGNGRVICAGTTSTKVRIISIDAVATTKGTVTSL